MATGSRPLWFKGTAAADWVTRFTVGDDYLWDTMLLPYDITATIAHADGLVSAGILERSDSDSIRDALGTLARRVADGDIVVTVEDEDSHTVIERYVTSELGDLGRKIHTGRSRNDQVLAALRLFLADAMTSVAGRGSTIIRELCDMAVRYDDAVMPGHTHLQRAMPTTAGLWAAGYAEMLVDDVDTLREARTHINVSPLGSAAGYGVPFLELPRESVSKALGFSRLQENVTVVQLSRGKLELHVAHACVQICGTLNRLASDLVLFNASEFGFVVLPDEFCTGSSIMPQKRNPDVLELVRASYHRVMTEMLQLAGLPANLPSGYHRDLQLTKESVMRAVLVADDVLTAAANVLPGVRFDRKKMRQACGPELMATAAALKLTLAGMPFREAYVKVASDSAGPQELPANLSEVYLVSGYPGRAAVAPILERLEQHREWLDGSR